MGKTDRSIMPGTAVSKEMRDSNLILLLLLSSLTVLLLLIFMSDGNNDSSSQLGGAKGDTRGIEAKEMTCPLVPNVNTSSSLRRERRNKTTTQVTWMND